jgi:uncharacterized OB-fold protein
MPREPEVDIDAVVRRDGRTDAFFDAAAANRLMIKRCAECRHWAAPDASDCTGCGGAELTWAEASGDATLVSWAVAHGKPGAASASAVLALVELAEGPWLHTRLDGADPAGLDAGLPLRAHFEHPAEGESVLVFRVL